MADLKNPRLLYFKGALFLLLGILSSGILLLKYADWKFAALLAVAIWSFSRAYYFAFYAIEHYIDPDFKFAGLGAFVRYLLAKRENSKSP